MKLETSIRIDGPFNSIYDYQGLKILELENLDNREKFIDEVTNYPQ